MKRILASVLLIGLLSAFSGSLALAKDNTVQGGISLERPVSPATVLVGVGSDTTQEVMGALAVSYNQNLVANPLGDTVFNINAVGGPYQAPGDLGCPEGVSYEANKQPNGSSAGITALANTDPAKSCLDFARSSRARKSTDPSFLAFHAFAKDAVTWASFSGGNAPSNLSKDQLKQIYTCQVTDWSQVGGTPGMIVRYLPQKGSGTLDFFLKKVLDGTSIPSSCAIQQIEENNGTQVSADNKPNAILPYSVAKWAAQANGVSADLRGNAVLHAINGIAPTKDNIASGKFPAIRNVYNVVRTDTPALEQFSLNQFFGKDGFICKDATARKIIARYGFVPLSAAKCSADLG